MRRILVAMLWLLALQPCLGQVITINHDLTIAPGDVYDGIDVVDSPPHRTTVDVLGGTTTSLRVLDSAVANIYGGDVLALAAGDQGTLNLFGIDRTMAIGIGGSAQLNLYGDAHQSAFAGETAKVSMYPGSAVGTLGMSNSVSGSLYGGSIYGALQLQGTSDVRIHKTDLREYLIAADQSTVEIYGRDFSYDPTGGQLGMGLIQGFWLDGTPLSISLATAPGATSDTYSHITFLPEPATLMLLVLGGVAMTRRRRQSRTESSRTAHEAIPSRRIAGHDSGGADN